MKNKNNDNNIKDFLNAYNQCFYHKNLDALKEFYNTDNDVLIYFDNHKNNDTYSVDEHLELISNFFENGKLTESKEVEPLIIENLKIFNKGLTACICFISRYKSFPVPAVRSTLYIESTNSKWKIIHAHFSFEPEH